MLIGHDILWNTPGKFLNLSMNWYSGYLWEDVGVRAVEVLFPQKISFGHVSWNFFLFSSPFNFLVQYATFICSQILLKIFTDLELNAITLF